MEIYCVFVNYPFWLLFCSRDDVSFHGNTGRCVWGYASRPGRRWSEHGLVVGGHPPVLGLQIAAVLGRELVWTILNRAFFFWVKKGSVRARRESVASRAASRVVNLGLGDASWTRGPSTNVSPWGREGERERERSGVVVFAYAAVSIRSFYDFSYLARLGREQTEMRPTSRLFPSGWWWGGLVDIVKSRDTPMACARCLSRSYPGDTQNPRKIFPRKRSVVAHRLNRTQTDVANRVQPSPPARSLNRDGSTGTKKSTAHARALLVSRWALPPVILDPPTVLYCTTRSIWLSLRDSLTLLQSWAVQLDRSIAFPTEQEKNTTRSFKPLLSGDRSDATLEQGDRHATPCSGSFGGTVQ